MAAKVTPSKNLWKWIDANRATMTAEQLNEALRAHLALRTLELNAEGIKSPALTAQIKEALKDFADGMGGEAV